MMGDMWLLEGCKKKCPALESGCFFFEGFKRSATEHKVCEKGLYALRRYDLWKTRGILSKTAEKIAKERAES
jgi:hypothetical protein